MKQIPDHPSIRRIESTGYTYIETHYPRCPVCGSECSTVYYVKKEIVGCDECVSTGDAWEADACFPERN